LECERVAPKLVISTKSDAKEWRAHIENTKNFSENIKKILPDARNKLEKVTDSLGKVLDTISKREKAINSNMNELVIFSKYNLRVENIRKNPRG
jgi:estrogen-related receptor beta like 1